MLADGAGLANPQGIATDGAGNMYVADYANNKIREVTAAGVMTTLAGSGTMGELDGSPGTAQFSAPWGIAYDGAGNLYVSDYIGDVIRKVVISTGQVSTYAGIATTPGNTNSTLLASKFKNPAGITLDASGNIYVADGGNNLIRMISGNTVSTLAGSGAAGSANGVGILASFNGPKDVVADGSGNLFVADYLNNRIRKIVISTGVGAVSTGSEFIRVILTLQVLRQNLAIR